MANEKQHAHEMIEQLPPHQLSAVVGLLEAMVDPVSRRLAEAPIDDELETEEERRAVEQSKEWLRQRGGKAFRIWKCSRFWSDDRRFPAHGARLKD